MTEGREVLVKHVTDNWGPLGAGEQADAVIAALAAAGMEVRKKVPAIEEETGWLIERGDSQPSAPDYWGWSDGVGSDDGPGLDWTSNHLEALRFARKIDAERYAEDIGWNNVRIAEHGWYGPCVGEHEWFKPDFIAYECCRNCGIVKRADGKNKPCKGKVGISLRAGIPDLRWHDLRRTCGCRLLQDHGLSIEKVSKWLGHQSIAVTERAYAFLNVEHLHKAIEHAPALERPVIEGEGVEVLS